MFALDVGAMSASLGGFPLSHQPLFGDFCMFNSTSGCFINEAFPGCVAGSQSWKSHSSKVTVPINISLPQFYVFPCICLLWDGSCGRWGRFPYPLNTVEAGAQRLVRVPKLELQGPPTLPRLLCSPPGRTLLQPVVAYQDRMKTNWHR